MARLRSWPILSCRSSTACAFGQARLWTAIGICPVTATKSMPRPSQKVIEFAGRRAARSAPTRRSRAVRCKRRARRPYQPFQRAAWLSTRKGAWASGCRQGRVPPMALLACERPARIGAPLARGLRPAVKKLPHRDLNGAPPSVLIRAPQCRRPCVRERTSPTSDGLGCRANVVRSTATRPKVGPQCLHS